MKNRDGKRKKTEIVKKGGEKGKNSEGNGEGIVKFLEQGKQEGEHENSEGDSERKGKEHVRLWGRRGQER